MHLAADRLSHRRGPIGETHGSHLTRVAALIPGGPAEQAGMHSFRVIREQKQRGAFLYQRTIVDRSYADVIQAVDGERVRSFDQFLTLIEEKSPGEIVTLGVLRNGEPRLLRIQLAAEE